MNGNILPIEIMARREDWSNGISLYARQTIVDVKSLIAKPLEFTDYQPGSVVDPFIRFETSAIPPASIPRLNACALV